MELKDLNANMLLGDAEEAVVPPSTLTTDAVMDMSFHPTLPLLAAGLVSGEVEIFEYHGNEMVKRRMQNNFSSWLFGVDDSAVAWSHHHDNVLMHPQGSVATMEFTDDGSYLVTASSDRTVSVLDCETSKLVIHLTAAQTEALKEQTEKKKKAALAPLGKKKLRAVAQKKAAAVNPHKFGISALNVCDENLIATGDDDGLIAIWDMRARRPAFTYHEHGDYVSQLCYFSDVQELVSSSGDTCLIVYDVRGGKVRDFSEKRKDEISCFAFINSSGANNSTFIPSIVCGTPGGALPLWKYGSWSRPYDTLEYHPKEVDSIISFHGENTAFNHNIILTGACDGLVRVIQMYPMRRNLCQLSARDYTYSHANTLGVGGRAHHEYNTSFVVKRKRGHEAIHRMRLSHDSNVLAVSGFDNIIDFVDVRFLSNEKQLDTIRGKAEQRHMETLREMERDAQATAAREERHQRGEFTSSSNSDSSDSDSDSDSDSEAERPSGKKGKEAAPKSKKTTKKKKAEEATPRTETTPMTLRQRLEEVRLRRVEEKRARDAERLQKIEEERERAEEEGRPLPEECKPRGRKGEKKKKKSKNETIIRPGTGYDDDDDSDSSGGEVIWARDDGDGEDAPPARERPSKAAPAAPAAASAEEAPGEGGEEPPKEKTERDIRRERSAAARWLKEEKRKKINFTYEKRRRRVGGFFGDLSS
ncbi:WD domain containing protein [Strigomonas culicis]|uniref:WD domain containing protein n=2 Tax=Strigomonas culicis TaxID=28005 RepID=S9UHQ2_9TRYP|nr:WD domain containing protein [Strigomonas culicis]|eukprot:EPY30352.1 WD domain containing protein [Strigomonas culicis]